MGRFEITSNLCSRQTLTMADAAPAKAGVPLKRALKKGVAAGTLKMGGAAGKKGAGCFKIGEKAKVEKKKPKKVVKKKKPAAKKAKKPAKKAAKKPAAKKAAAKKPAAKKAAKK